MRLMQQAFVDFCRPNEEGHSPRKEAHKSIKNVIYLHITKPFGAIRNFQPSTSRHNQSVEILQSGKRFTIRLIGSVKK